MGLLEEIARSHPRYVDPATAGATTDWFNVYRCEEFGHGTGCPSGREIAELVR